MSEPVFQIVIEQIQENDDSIVWEWSAFGEDRLLFSGEASTLIPCIENMLRHLKDEGIG